MTRICTVSDPISGREGKEREGGRGEETQRRRDAEEKREEWVGAGVVVLWEDKERKRDQKKKERKREREKERKKQSFTNIKQFVAQVPKTGRRSVKHS